MNNQEKAQDPNTSSEELAVLATNEDWEVRYNAAHNPNATELVRRLFLMTEAQTSSKTGTRPLPLPPNPPYNNQVINQTPMTARIRSLTIALDEDIRTDDIECLVNAIQMMRNVHSVTTNEVNPNDWVTERRVKLETAQKLNNLINEIIKFKLNNLITELYTN